MSELAEIGFPDGLASAASVVMSTRLAPKTKFALWLLCEGMTYREAAKRAGVHKNALHRAAQRHGVCPVQAMRKNERRLILESVEIIRQTAGLSGMSPKQLARVV